MKQRYRVLLIGLLGLVATAVLLYLGVSYVLYNELTNIAGACELYEPNQPANFGDPRQQWQGLDMDFEPYWVPNYELVYFPSREVEFTIAGWYLENDPTAPAVIVVHGINACKRNPVVLTQAGMLWHNGFNVLVMDMRDAGDSDYEDGRSAIGTEEYLDVLGAWDWLQAEKGFTVEQIGVVGNSLGAGTVLIAFAQEPDLAAVFVDSPIDNLPQIIKEELILNNYPQFLYPGGILVGRLIGDDLLAYNPYEAMEQAGNRPVFIVHGTADQRVGFHHSQQLMDRAKSASANAIFWAIPDVGHVEGAATHTAEYEQRLVSFFQQALVNK